MTAFKNGPGITTLPEAPQPGEAVYDASLSSYRYHDGTSWVGIPPVGIVEAYGGYPAPAGWLLCDGSAVSRTTYALLFDVLGTIYGAGNGSTTFNVPDLRGRAVHGTDDMGGTPAKNNSLAALGATGGHQYTQAHSHYYSTSGTSGNDSPDHAHQWTLASAGNAQGTGDLPFRGYNYWDGGFRSGGTAWWGYGGGTGLRHTHTYSFSGTSAGHSLTGGSNHNVPPSLTVSYIIKT